MFLSLFSLHSKPTSPMPASPAIVAAAVAASPMTSLVPARPMSASSLVLGYLLAVHCSRKLFSSKPKQVVTCSMILSCNAANFPPPIMNGMCTCSEMKCVFASRLLGKKI